MIDAGAHDLPDGVAAGCGQERAGICHARHGVVRPSGERDRVATEVEHSRDPAGREPVLVDQVEVHMVVDQRRQRDARLTAQRAAAQPRFGAEKLAQQEGSWCGIRPASTIDRSRF